MDYNLLIDELHIMKVLIFKNSKMFYYPPFFMIIINVGNVSYFSVFTGCVVTCSGFILSVDICTVLIV